MNIECGGLTQYVWTKTLNEVGNRTLNVEPEMLNSIFSDELEGMTDAIWGSIYEEYPSGD